MLNFRALFAAGCLASSACASGPQLRPLPPPEDCPPGAAEAMKQLDIHYGWHGALFAPFEGPISIVPAQEGPVTVMSIGRWGGLPDWTFFSGQLYVGTNRVYGRFTEARLPSGEVVPVCLEMVESIGEGPQRGVSFADGSTPERPLIISSVSIEPVLRFE